MFNTLFADQTDAAIDAQAERGRTDPPPQAGMFKGIGSGLATALPAAALEMGRAGVSLFDMQVGAQKRIIEAQQGRDIPIEEMFKQSETARDLGKTIKSIEPDPQTTGKAAQVIHGLAKYAGKTAGYALATGPATPLMMGLDETLNEAQRLADQGVDVETRNKAALVHGGMTAAATAVPVAGKTRLQTAALAMVSGPAAFVGEQAVINKILDDADYTDIAKQYDPFDITGLLLSTAAPLTFGAAVHMGRARAGRAAIREAEDAARVVIEQERAQRNSGAPVTDAQAQEEHAQAVKAAEDRINAGQSIGEARVSLQNRDRSTPASVVQMAQIAGNPDYARLSPSRSLAEGTPVVLDEATIPPERIGRSDVAVDAQGGRVNVRYAVVEADTLLPSHRADGTAIREYKDGQEGRLRAVAGNGRIAGLQAAFDRGNAGSYVEEMGKDTQAHGIDQTVIAGMERPVLVRLMDKGDVTANMGDRTNVSGVSDLSPLEQAATDSARVRLDALEFTDNGMPTPDTIKRFVQGMPDAERAGLMDNRGQTVRQAEDRLMNAVFHRAYGDPELVHLYAAASDPEARTVINSLAAIAPDVMKLEGAGDLDLRPHLVMAAKLAVNSKRMGIKLSDLVFQMDMTVPEETRAIAKVMADNIGSAKRMTEALRELSARAVAEAEKAPEDMFGPVPRATLGQLLGAEPARPPKPDLDPVAVRDKYRSEVEAIEGATPEQAEAFGRHFESAARDKPAFDALVRRLSEINGGVARIPGLKGAPRSFEKTMADYGGDVGRLKDAVRATIELPTIENVQAVIDSAKAEFGDLIGLRNTLIEGVEPGSPDGYRDVKFNVRLPGGTVAELQINTPAMLAAKDQAHVQYEAVRSIKAKADIEKRQLTPDEIAKVAELEAEMARTYDAAWADSTAARKTGSESSEPLRRNESYGNGRGAPGSGPSENAQATAAGSAGAAETSTPSTSAKRVPSGNDAGSFIRASEDILLHQPVDGLDTVMAEAETVALQQPDMQIELDDGTRISAAEAMRQADAEIQQAQSDARAFEAAVGCLIRTGG